VDGNCRSLHCATPDFLLVLMALANFMRLSLLKAAHAFVSSAGWQEIRVRSGRDDKFVAGKLTEFPVESRGTADPLAALGMTKGERTIDLVPRLRRSDPLQIDFPALPGWADVWRSALRALHLWPSLPCHFSLNLPQASQLLGMTKERASLL
jgi:hypothetical protein